MLLQHNDHYRLNVEVQWIDPEQVRLAFRRTDLGIEYSDHEYYLTPQELIRLTDHIRDVLAQ